MKELNTTYVQSSDESSIDLAQIVMHYLSYWKWFVVSVALLVAAGLVYLSSVTPVYEIRASILIKENNGARSSLSALDELDMFSTSKVLENEIEIIRSRTLIEEVASTLNLQVSYSVQEGLRAVPLDADRVPFVVTLLDPASNTQGEPLEVTVDRTGQIKIDGKGYLAGDILDGAFGKLRIDLRDSLLAGWEPSTKVEVNIYSFSGVVEALRRSLTVAPSAKGTTVLNLSMLWNLPRQGEQIIDHLIAAYNRASVADKTDLARITLNFIDERLQLLAVDLQDVERDVEQYKSSQGITDINSEAQLFLQSVQNNDLELSKIDIQLGVLQDIRTYINRPESAGGVAPATLGISDPTLLSLIGSLVAAETERAKALQTVKPANPIILAMDDQIRELRARISDNVATLGNSLEITRRKLAEDNRRFDKMITSIPRKERELTDITRQQEIKNQLYVYLLTKREETAISYASTLSDSRLVDRARSSAWPVKPEKRKIMLVFALLGLVLPVVVIWVSNLVRHTIRTKDDIEKKCLVPLVGEIPYFDQATRVIDMSKAKSRPAEQIRSLRTNVGFMMTSDSNAKVVLVTSSISGEGKSFIAGNLGSAYAALGKRVVVLGFDLRKSGLHKLFGLENDKGLSDYLTGQATLDQVIRPVGTGENLALISCGHLAPNPQELLQSQPMETLFAELRKRYDYIIIDSAPVGLVGDAKILDRQADVTLYIVRQHLTPKDRIQFVNELSQTKQLCNMGVVVNCITDDRWYGYNSSYGSYRYYGKYYGEDNDTKKRRRR